MIIKKQHHLLLQPLSNTSQEEFSFLETENKKTLLTELKPDLKLIEHAIMDWKDNYSDLSTDNLSYSKITFLAFSFISITFLLNLKINSLGSISIPFFYLYFSTAISTFLIYLFSLAKSQTKEKNKFHRIFSFLNSNNYSEKIFSLDIKKFWLEHVEWFLKNTSQKSFYFDGQFIDSKNLLHYISKNYGKSSSNSWIFSTLTNSNKLFLNRIKGASYAN